MKQFNVVIETAQQIDDYLNSKTIRKEINSAKSVLVQLYTDKPECKDTIRFVETIKNTIPQALVIGATSAGGIANGHQVLNATILSLSFFHDAKLIPFTSECHSGEEYNTGIKIAEALEGIPNLKGILILASPILVNCASILNGIHDHLNDTIVFGGGAAGIDHQNGLVFLNDLVLDNGGVVAVGLTGDDLYIESTMLSGWKTVGPELTLTDVDGFDVLKINRKPAFDVFRRYFKLNPGDDLFLLEFPLLVKRQETLLPRNPVSSGVDGRVSLIADIYQGEKAWLGYLDVDDVIDNMEKAYGVMEQFLPEAIFLYSCICRRFALQQDIEIETLPFERIAPAGGFFTYGEFCKTTHGLELLNSSEVVIGIREGSPKASTHSFDTTLINEVDHYRVRHIQVTSRLFQFISALTDELEDANKALKFQADHDPLTGAFNRHTLDKNINAEISFSKRHGHQVSFILLDIDYFKTINDKYGHLAGDYALKGISETIAGLLRAKDALYRYGGEEFLLILPETSLEGARAVAEKVRKAISSTTLAYNELQLPVITASFGVASYPEHGYDAESIISILDKALYVSKDSGRNQITVGN
jgi:diguanylate cyclase (GGDEF)-like protein